MELILSALPDPPRHLPQVPLRVNRDMLLKRRWRGKAEDGKEFGFDLQRPFKHQDVFHSNDTCCYTIDQQPEPLLLVMLVTPSQAARLAWMIGNLHFPISVRADALLVPDDPAVRMLFQRERITFMVVHEVFQPVSDVGHPHAH